MFPRQTGRTVSPAWEILAPAKLNLYLEVLGPRADGFHEMETLMVPVRLFDQLSWHEDELLSLRIHNLLPLRHKTDPFLGDAGSNLVVQAAKLLAKTAGIKPRGRFDLIKRIPLQAGMGGGSSDAAAALLLANRAWNVGYSREQLEPLAAELGSDVPFFLSQGAAVCRGRGEIIEPVAGLPRLHFVVVKPEAGLSTPEVFAQLSRKNESQHELVASSRSRLTDLLTALRRGAISSAGRHMTNRLEAAAAPLAPWLDALRQAFSRAGCVGQFMTGSGSAYVGVMRSALHARRTAQQLARKNLGNTFATSNY